MRILKKIMALSLALVILVSGMLVENQVQASSSSGIDGNITWSLDGTILTISGNGDMPDYNGWDPWGTGGGPWGENVTEVIINEGIKSIGNNAFYNCTELKKITMPNSVTTIGTWAFYFCTSLKDVVIPKNVTTIDDYAFSHCNSLTSIDIPDGVTSIGNDAFFDCDLKAIVIPKNVTYIGSRAFSGNDNLVSVMVAEENPVYRSAGNCIIETESKTLVAACNKSIIPDDGSVTVIGDSAFRYCRSVKNIIIPDGVITLGDSAFSDCYSLKSIAIPNSVKSLGANVFSLCEELSDMTIPDGVTSIGHNAFDRCNSLESIRIPKDLTFFPYNMGISSCESLTTLEVAEGNQVYHSAGNCIIETESKTLVAGCKASVIPDDGSVTAIGDSAFEFCTNLTNIIIPEGVTSIGRYAFRYCTGLENIMLPNTLEFIGWWAFDECPRLKKIGLPNGITTIEQSAFANSGVQEVWYGGDETDKESLEIEGNNDSLINATWHYNACLSHNYAYACDSICDTCGFTRIAAKHTYENEDDLTCDVCGETVEFAWSVDGTVLTIRGMGDIPDYDSPWESAAQTAPWGTDVTTVIIKDGIKSIGDYAFYSLNQTVIHMPESVTDIGESACNYSCVIIAPKNSYAQEYANNNNYPFIDADDPSKIITSIEIEDIEIIEGTGGSYNGEDFFYHINLSLKAEATFKNGEKQIINGGFGIDDRWYSFNTNEWEMQNEDPWEAGNTYEVTGTLLGVSDTFNVTIVESPIESIVLEDIVLFEGVDSSDNGGWEYYDVRPVLSAVLLKNGEYADIENDWYIQYDGEYHVVSVDVGSMQYEEHWEVGRTYTVTGTLLGVSATFNVTIQENPIREIELLEMPDKTEYLVAELFNLKGATFRLWYNDNSYEDIVINEEHFGFFWEAVWSHKLNKYGWIYMQYDFQEVEQTIAEVSVFGMTCEIPITVKENLMESISIKENVDKTISITVNNSDGTSYDMIILDMWPTDSGSYEVYTLLTDKGLFDAAFYCSEDSFSIEMGELYSENGIKSNSLSGSAWYQAVKNFNQFCSSILPDNDNFLNFNGQVTEDNIDRIIGTAFYMEYIFSWDDEDVVWEGDYATISGGRIRESLAKYFALENVDLTLSESYDAQSDTYELFDYIRSSWVKTRPTKISYNNGIWSMKNTYLDDEGVEKNTYLKLNDEQKIISYRVNATEMVGDTDDDGELTDWDGVVLARYLAGWNVEINSLTTIDVDGDGELTDWDGVILDRYLAGWNIQIGGQQ